MVGHMNLLSPNEVVVSDRHSIIIADLIYKIIKNYLKF